MSEEKPGLAKRAIEAVSLLAAVAFGARVVWVLLQPLVPILLAVLTLYVMYVLLFRRRE
jgi:hypothetical protein